MLASGWSPGLDPIAAVAVLLTVTAVFSWVNHRYIGLPVTIGVMLIAFFFSFWWASLVGGCSTGSGSVFRFHTVFSLVL